METISHPTYQLEKTRPDGEVVRLVALTDFRPELTIQPRTRGRAGWIFVLVVLLPTLLSGVYFGLIAPNQYVSEARFTIVHPNAGGRLPSTGMPLGGTPHAVASDDAYAVRDFLTSRDAMRLLIDKAGLREIAARVSRDPFWRFPSGVNGDSDERLYRYLHSLMSVNYDSSTGMTTLQTKAFSPADASQMALVLLDGCEALVNRLNSRAREDALRVAEGDVARARAEALSTEDKLTAFRNQWSLVDPSAFAQTVFSTITALSLQEVEAAAMLDVTIHSSPKSPQVAPLQARIRALQDQIERERERLAGSNDSLAPRVAEYERLLLLRDFAAKSFVAALSELETVRLDGERQEAYLSRVVTPVAPDEPAYPFRIGSPLLTLAIGLIVFAVVRPASKA